MLIYRLGYRSAPAEMRRADTPGVDTGYLSIILHIYGMESSTYARKETQGWPAVRRDGLPSHPPSPSPRGRGAG